MVDLPEVLWDSILSYANLLDAVLATGVSRGVARAAASPALPCRTHVDIFALRRALKDPADFPAVASLVGPTSHVALGGGAFPRLATLRLVHAGSFATLRSATAALGSGGYHYLRSLEITVGSSGRRPAYLWPRDLLLASRDTRAETRARAGADDRALYGLVVDRNALGDPAESLPALEDLLLGEWSELWNLRIYPRAEPPLDGLMRTCRRLRRVSLPGAPGARHLDRRGRPWPPGLRVNALTRKLLPPLRLRCGRCGDQIFDRVDACFLGHGTRAHIAFELFFDAEPSSSRATDGRPSRRNCPRDCHGPEGRFLLAARGDCVNTRGFAWAAACGDDLVRCEDADTGEPLDAAAFPRLEADPTGYGGLLDGPEENAESDGERLARLAALAPPAPPADPRTTSARLLERLSLHIADLGRAHDALDATLPDADSGA